jgi:hypothetical protein
MRLLIELPPASHGGDCAQSVSFHVADGRAALPTPGHLESSGPAANAAQQGTYRAIAGNREQ